jgi:type IV secretory pathway TraG/TraD family ATPase VirD4
MLRALTHKPTHSTVQGHMENYREQSFMNSNEIHTMKDDEVLIVSDNQDPIKIPSRAYFEVGRMKRATDTTRYPSVPVEAACMCH